MRVVCRCDLADLGYLLSPKLKRKHVWKQFVPDLSGPGAPCGLGLFSWRTKTQGGRHERATLPESEDCHSGKELERKAPRLGSPRDLFLSVISHRCLFRPR